MIACGRRPRCHCPPFSQAKMAVFRLITLGMQQANIEISSSNGATHCHRPPFSQAETAALKLITFEISLSNGATRCHCPSSL
eukprot:1279441-Karenia_brevis.AAC.1